MSDFYESSPDEQAVRLEALARVALANWSLGDVASIFPVKLRENAVYCVETDRAKYALRVHRAGYHGDAQLLSELQWIEAINSDVLRTPQVVPTRAGELFARASAPDVPEERQVDVLEWFEGETLGGVEDPLALLDDAREIGALMATTHNHSEHWQRPSGFTRHAWDESGILGPDPLWGRHLDLALLTPEQRARLERAEVELRAELATFGKEPDRYGLIHADFIPDNLLRNDTGICLIDFDDCGFGWHLFDLATPLFFQLGADDFDERCEAMVVGYRSRRALSDEHLARLPMFLLLRGLTYLGWAQTRSETATARDLAPRVVEAVDALATELLAEA